MLAALLSIGVKKVNINVIILNKLLCLNRANMKQKAD